MTGCTLFVVLSFQKLKAIIRNVTIYLKIKFTNKFMSFIIIIMFKIVFMITTIPVTIFNNLTDEYIHVPGSQVDCQIINI